MNKLIESVGIGVTGDDPEHGDSSDAIDALQRTRVRLEWEQPLRVRVDREALQQTTRMRGIWKNMFVMD